MSEGGAVDIDFDAHGLSQDDVEKMISDVVFFFLVEDQKKSLIQRPDVMSKCGINKKARQIQEYVLNKASHKLLDTFGIQVGCWFRGLFYKHTNISSYLQLDILPHPNFQLNVLP